MAAEVALFHALPWFSGRVLDSRSGALRCVL